MHRLPPTIESRYLLSGRRPSAGNVCTGAPPAQRPHGCILRDERLGFHLSRTCRGTICIRRTVHAQALTAPARAAETFQTASTPVPGPATRPCDGEGFA